MSISGQLRVLGVALAVGVTTIVGPAASATPAVPDQTAQTARRTVTRATIAQRHSVERLYRAYFLRRPDTAGHDYWASQYSSGRRSLNSISQFFALSDEFKTRYGSLSNVQFVRMIYRNVLNREPDAAGRSHWLGRLNAGSSRGSVMVGFSESPEFQRATRTVPPGAPVVTWQSELLTLVNRERSRVGVASLRWCPPIAVASQRHASDQAARNVMSHLGSDGSNGGVRMSRADYRWTVWAENVAYGYLTPAEVVAAWMSSGEHRRNLLDSDLAHMGAGRAIAANGLVFWAQNFGDGGTC